MEWHFSKTYVYGGYFRMDFDPSSNHKDDYKEIIKYLEYEFIIKSIVGRNS